MPREGFPLICVAPANMIRFPKRNGKGINIMDKSMDRTVAWLALVLTAILTILSATTLHQAINAPIDPTKRMEHFAACTTWAAGQAVAGRVWADCPQPLADWHMGRLLAAGFGGIMALLSLGFTIRQFQRARPDALPRTRDEEIISRETSRLKTLKAQDDLKAERAARAAAEAKLAAEEAERRAREGS